MKQVAEIVQPLSQQGILHINRELFLLSERPQCIFLARLKPFRLVLDNAIRPARRSGVAQQEIVFELVYRILVNPKRIDDDPIRG